MKSKNKKIFLFTLGCISVVLYLMAPMKYSMDYVLYCTGCFLASSLVMFSSNCKYTFIKFELIFLVAFFFTNYVYALIFYPINPHFSLFRIAFNESYITKGTALATVAAAWFNYGIFEPRAIMISNRTFSETKKRLKIPQIIPFILLIIFIPYLLVIYVAGKYSTEFESSIINAILKYLVLYIIFAFLFDNRYRKFVKVFKKAITTPVILLIAVYTALFLLIGSRTIPLAIALFSLILINILVYTLSKKKVVLLMLGGALLMTSIGLARGGSGIESGEVSSIWDLGADLVINNRSLFVLMDQADKNGFSYGMSMMMNLLSVIPFAQSIFLIITGVPLSSISSAVLVTDLHFGKGFHPDRFGLGTNLVGDVYYAFGLIGVIFLFWFLGHFLKKIYYRLEKGNYVALLLYALLFMDAIYFTRSGYLTPVRDVTWVLVIFWWINHKKKINA